MIAVNREEHPQQIRSVLKRRMLSPTAALDRDGTISARYSVTAIPQTLVIDAEGKIARVYFGGAARSRPNNSVSP